MHEVARFYNWLGGWVPSWVMGLALLLLAGTLAASLCRWVFGRLYRLSTRFGTVPALMLTACRNPSCAMLVLFTLGAVLPFAPFSLAAATAIGHLLLAAFIVVLGWSVINTMDLFADLYIQRWRMDEDDNLLARKHRTQIGILRGAMRTLIVLLTLAIALMTSNAVRQYGVSLFASAGAAGIVVGLAARPLLSNLLAGIQIAITQPIRIEDAVIVEGEWGWVERIGATYVVIRIWDLRRLIVPLSYFIEQPFQNWTHQSADMMGTVMLYVDYTVPVQAVRAKLSELLAANIKWDRKIGIVQMTDLPEERVELRLLMSARNSSILFDLRCEIREAMVAWLLHTYPEALPRSRLELSRGPVRGAP
jgi:small-conductance mechanosensitive channel